MPKNLHTLIKICFIAEKCEVSSEPVANYNPYAGGRSCLNVDSC